MPRCMQMIRISLCNIADRLRPCLHISITKTSFAFLASASVNVHYSSAIISGYFRGAVYRVSLLSGPLLSLCKITDKAHKELEERLDQ